MLVKSVSFSSASIKSMNPMQKYPLTTELFACTRKVLAVIFLFSTNFFNFFRKLKTIEINYFTSVTK